MESTENRKLKAPVGSTLLWIYAVLMLDAGLISQEDYDAKKKQVLDL